MPPSRRSRRGKERNSKAKDLKCYHLEKKVYNRLRKGEVGRSTSSHKRLISRNSRPLRNWYFSQEITLGSIYTKKSCSFDVLKREEGGSKKKGLSRRVERSAWKKRAGSFGGARA